MACTVDYMINVDNTGSGFRTLARVAPYTDTTKTVAREFVATTKEAVLYLDTHCVKGTLVAIYFDDITVASNQPFCASAP